MAISAVAGLTSNLLLSSFKDLGVLSKTLFAFPETVIHRDSVAASIPRTAEFRPRSASPIAAVWPSDSIVMSTRVYVEVWESVLF